MSAHSPGPWVWQGIHRDGAPVLYACGGEKHRLVKGASHPRLSVADARLIAAAPDLLAMLQEAMGWLGDASAYNGTSGGDDFDDRYSALMKKIEGE